MAVLAPPAFEGADHGKYRHRRAIILRSGGVVPFGRLSWRPLFELGSFRKGYSVCGCCLGSGVRTGLDHAITSYEEFGVWVDGKAIEQRLQLRPKSIAAQGGDRVEFSHGVLLCVCGHDRSFGPANHPITERRSSAESETGPTDTETGWR